ncbi:sulfite exporter TauE/SafE family protein [Cellulophaga sp. E16_2]|uniref:Integral membrane protein n=1 Tax=Cellulophaga algicola (strain DSM 14237 / IC166 / ACAM 630) TaxID=688270 RepID=E6XF17_CELAD|nr:MULTISPECIES: sulfite exporter TauE/SafE family protein [Cellulophaga]ADV49239.1 integral membrane protein [Cellulophaga algicola DSM 14237]MBO0591705.1 sulfite exporter TauE/SafE family protein [Cellulophaga sp. E16_2]
MFISAIILGLMGSFHCVGMCGPIAFMLPVDRTSNIKKFSQIFIYHLGRLLAYGTLGLVFGLLGKGLFVFGMQQKLSIAIGVLMIIVVLLPHKFISTYNFSKPMYKLIGKVKSRLGKELQKKTADTFITIGFLNGFLPCGLVYMGLFGAIAMGSPLKGALYMVLFGAGTIPLMTTAIYFSSLLKGAAKQKVQKLIPVFVVLIGALFILRGLGLGIPYVSPKPVTEVVSSNLECHN